MKGKRILCLLAAVGVFSSCENVQNAGDSSPLEDSTQLESVSLEKAVDSMGEAVDSIEPNVASLPLNLITLPANSVEDRVVFDEPDDIDSEQDISQFPTCPEPAYKQECRSDQRRSTQTQVYERCLNPKTNKVLSGRVRLVYNNPDCSLENDGDRVRRHFAIKRLDLATGEKSYATSRRQNNYLGRPIGGGQGLKNTPWGWKLGVRGVNRAVRIDGVKVKEIAIHSQRAFNIYDKREEGALFLHGGALIINHNLAQFTSKYVPKKLKWVEGCKCPVSGKLLYKHKGSREARGFVEFLGCGKAVSVTEDGVEREWSRSQCAVSADVGESPDTEAPEDIEPVDDQLLEDELEDIDSLGL